MKLYTDGSFNWKRSTAYWVVVREGELIASGDEEDSSSNRGEMLGVINALATPGVEVVCTASIFSGEYTKIKHNLDLVEKLLAFRGKAAVEWVPREQNSIADNFVGKMSKEPKKKRSKKHVVEAHTEAN
jgi:ribonuclease HI